MATNEALHSRTRDFVRDGVDYTPGSAAQIVTPDAEWQKLRDVGTRLWLDTGDLEEASRLLTAEFEALTTNNTLLNNEIQKGIYDDLMAQAAQTIREAAPAIDDRELVLEIAFLLNAWHGLRLVKQFDVYVSVELHTDLANDVERSVAYGKRFFAICPERFIIKVPLTPSGFLAARRLSQARIPVNFTLGFSARQNYVAALIAQPAFVNVFMGRLGAFLADNDLGPGTNVGEKATLATQRNLMTLRKSGVVHTHLIGASMRTSEQVETLAGLDVFTMPTKVAAGYHEQPAASICSRVHDTPEVPLNDGVNFADFAGETLWHVPTELRRSTKALAEKDLDKMTADDLQSHFANDGFPDLFPRWTGDEIATLQAEGKIPVYATWKDKLQGQKVGLDALMNAAALYSFVTDQAALDDRIRDHL